MSTKEMFIEQEKKNGLAYQTILQRLFGCLPQWSNKYAENVTRAQCAFTCTGLDSYPSTWLLSLSRRLRGQGNRIISKLLEVLQHIMKTIQSFFFFLAFPAGCLYWSQDSCSSDCVKWSPIPSTNQDGHSIRQMFHTMFSFLVPKKIWRHFSVCKTTFKYFQ